MDLSDHIPTYDGTTPLTRESIERFGHTGILRLSAAVSAAHIARCQDLLWQELRALAQVDRDRPSTWTPITNTVLKPLAQRPEFHFWSLPRARATLDALYGTRRLAHQVPRGRFLASPPSQPKAGSTWRLPTGDGTWHWDGRPDLHPWTIWTLTLVMPLAPRSGGMLMLTGTNRLLSAMFAAQSACELATPSRVQRARFRQHHPWFAPLRRNHPLPEPDEHALLHDGVEVEGHRVRAVEISGSAGDVILMAGWTIHSRPPWIGPAGRFIHVSS
jgi:hypothetical protein